MFGPILSLCLLVVMGAVVEADYDYSSGSVTLLHAENAYCDLGMTPVDYSTTPLAGFVPTLYINNTDHSTRGYIGYNEGQQAIYVSFRGSEDINNWITNLDAIKTDYPLCSGCEVHKGFYTAEQAVFGEVLAQVQSLLSKYPGYTVFVTGHSLGAALATLTANDLTQSGIKIRLFNYGSPRIGNDEFAEFTSSFLTDRNRVTHHKDMVVHTPPHETFTHISGEYYESDDTVSVMTCVGYEDPNCSYQWSITSISDHLYYMGVVMGGDGCSAIWH